VRIDTATLGTIEIDDQKVMEFVGPLLGMEGVQRCALLDLNPHSPIKVLQVTDDPRRSFLVADPTIFFPDYRVSLAEPELRDLGLTDLDEAAVLVLLSLRSDLPTATANLLGPLVVNTRNLRVKQFVLTGSGYRADEPLPIKS
jgi:flagellar assembly factor FliW